MTRYLSLPFLALSFLCGCASTPHELDKQPLSMSTMMNVSAGMFQSLQTSYPVKENSHKTDIRFKMGELRLGSVWVPMVSFCLRLAESSHNNECLQFLASEREGKIQPRHYSKPRNFDAHSKTALKPRYEFGESINVSIRDVDGKTEFWANGELLFSGTAFSPSASLEFSCSSVVCNFEFLQ
jgi:hypothetical protein